MILSHLSEPGDAWLLQCPRSDPIRSELAKIFGVNAMRCEFLGKETAKILRLLDDAGIPARMSMSAHSERKSFRQKPRGQLYLANQALILPIHESSDGIARKTGRTILIEILTEALTSRLRSTTALSHQSGK